jgi:hypothetical protein
LRPCTRPDCQRGSYGNQCQKQFAWLHGRSPPLDPDHRGTAISIRALIAMLGWVRYRRYPQLWSVPTTEALWPK